MLRLRVLLFGSVLLLANLIGTFGFDVELIYEAPRFNQPGTRMTLRQMRRSPDVWSSCDELSQKSMPSGVYRINTNLAETAVVYCDQEYDGGGWTVIQNRFDGSVNFDRYLDEYQQGFGNIDGGEFWIGLNLIHQLTYLSPHELVVLLKDFEGNSTYAKLDWFEVSGARQKYTLTRAEGFSGTTEDNLSQGKGFQFYNRIAWWARSPYESNVNGRYRKGNVTIPNSYPNMIWRMHDTYYLLKSSRVMIRKKPISQ